MRGKAVWYTVSVADHGITPAYAGKSIFPEKKQVNKLGSPPPMRGKDDMIEIDEAYSRITPAYAGKSCYACLHAARAWDHPRLCGEKH